PADFTRSINNGVSFQSPVALPLPSMKWGTLDTGADGTLYLAGATLDTSGHLFTKSTNAMNPEDTPTFDPIRAVNLGGRTVGGGPNPAGLLGQVWIAVDNSTGPTAGNVYIAGTVNNSGDANPTNVRFIRSVDGGQTWSSPVLVNDDPASGAWHWFGTMSVAPNGRIDMIWNDTRNDPGNFLSEVFYSFSTDAGLTWAANVALTPEWDPSLGYPNQSKIGDYYHMVSDNGGADLAYAATFNGEEDVYFLRIPRDCNNNNIEDDCDIACGAPGSRCEVIGCGTLPDCNGNVVPDVCEPNQDCNNNTVPDICDIGSGTSGDCNLNQIPDECESAVDCNVNSIPDICDIASGASQDCNNNTVPDDCDIASLASQDVNNDGVPDECEGACCTCGSCADLLPFECQSFGGSFSGLGVLCGEAGSCTPPAVPGNDDCAQAIELPSEPAVSEPFDNRCASLDGPEAANCPASQPFGADLWYNYVAPCTGSVTASLCNTTDFDSIMDVYGGGAVCPCPTTSAGVIVCGDDTCGQGGGPSQVTFNVTVGMCYTIRVAGWADQTGTGVLNLSYNTTCTVGPVTPVADPSGIDKSRFLSMVIPGHPSPALNNVAIRVTLVSLHHVDPPYTDGPSIPFTVFGGQVRWVGPPEQFVESASNPTTFYASFLQCAPHYREWNTLGVLHVTGSAIVPSSAYTARTLAASCQGNESSCTSVSGTLQLQTTRWGDIETPYNPPVTNFADISALVSKYKSASGAPIKARALLAASDSFGVVKIAPNVNFTHTAACVNAYLGRPYPYTIASCP
ncbi:MAG: sialidase family protein, partial [Phycisphaerales bacterium]|nr:sialidase family protein [Phycisphaerales bacterium]